MDGFTRNIASETGKDRKRSIDSHLDVCVYIYVYIYMYVHTYIQAGMYIHILCIYTSACIYIYISIAAMWVPKIFTYVILHIYIYMYVFMYRLEPAQCLRLTQATWEGPAEPLGGES